MKKYMLVIIGMAVCASSAWAGVIYSDDFNRTDTLYDLTGAIAGPGWTTSVTGPGVRIKTNQLRFHSSTGSRALYNINADTGSDFTLSLGLTHLQNQQWAGMAFHVQDEANYYYLRTRGNGTANVQFGKVINSVDTVLLNSSASVGIANSVYHTLTATSVGGEYSFKVEDSIGAVIFDMPFTSPDPDYPDTTFTSGYAGVYAGSATTGVDFEFDNIDVVPEPGTFGLMGLAGAAVLFVRKRFMI